MTGENARETALNMLRSINGMFLARLFFIFSFLLCIAFILTLYSNGALRQAKNTTRYKDV